MIYAQRQFNLERERERRWSACSVNCPGTCCLACWRLSWFALHWICPLSSLICCIPSPLRFCSRCDFFLLIAPLSRDLFIGLCNPPMISSDIRGVEHWLCNRDSTWGFDRFHRALDRYVDCEGHNRSFCNSFSSFQISYLAEWQLHAILEGALEPKLFTFCCSHKFSNCAVRV